MKLNNINVQPTHPSWVSMCKLEDGSIQCQSKVAGHNVGLMFHVQLNHKPGKEYVFQAEGFSKGAAKSFLWVGLPVQGSGGLGRKITSGECLPIDTSGDINLRFVMPKLWYFGGYTKDISVRVAVLFLDTKKFDTFVVGNLGVCKANKFDIALLNKQIGLLKEQNETLRQENRALSESVSSLTSQLARVDNDLESNRVVQNQVISQTEDHLNQMVTQQTLKVILQQLSAGITMDVLRYLSSHGMPTEKRDNQSLEGEIATLEQPSRSSLPAIEGISGLRRFSSFASAPGINQPEDEIRGEVEYTRKMD